MSALPYRKNVCMLVFKRSNSGIMFLLGQRLGQPEIWQFPQGGVEANDSLEESVQRELEEELGSARTNFKIIAQLKHTHRYDFKTPPAYAIDRYRGQEQSFWLVEFLADDSQITLNGDHPEFTNFRWCSSAEVATCADPVRLKGYAGALSEAVAVLAANDI